LNNNNAVFNLDASALGGKRDVWGECRLGVLGERRDPSQTPAAEAFFDSLHAKYHYF